MKISFRKQVLTICLVVVILLSGSFVGVNAATDGKLIESVNSFMEEMKAKLIASGTDPKLVDQMTDAYIDERTGATVFEFGEVTENEGVSIMVTETVIEE